MKRFCAGDCSRREGLYCRGRNARRIQTCDPGRAQRFGVGARRVLCTFIERATASPRRVLPQGEDKISEREREVLTLLVAGRSNKEIADEVGIEVRTVKAHVSQLMRKIGVQNRIALSVYAITHSLLSSRP